MLGFPSNIVLISCVFDKRIKQDGDASCEKINGSKPICFRSFYVERGVPSRISHVRRSHRATTLAFLAVGITIITSRRIRDKRHDDSSPLFPFFSLISLLRFSRSTAGNPLLTFSVLGPHDGVRI